MLVINLPKKIYSEKSLNKAIKDYEKILKIKYKKKEDKFNLEIEPLIDDYDLDYLTNEFLNYILGLEMESYEN